jgi:DNA polymerase-3 subunit beta
MTETIASPLMTALDLAAIVIDRRVTNPILGNVLLTGDGTKAVVEATDLDLEVSIVVPGNLGRFMASAAIEPVRAAVEYLGGSPEFSSLESRTKLVVGETFNLSCLAVEDFPRLQPFAELSTIEIDAEGLLASLEACAPAMSTEETRYYLNGVYLHGALSDGPVLRFAATDGHRLVTVTSSTGVEVDLTLSAILPRKLVKLLIAALDAYSGEDDTVRIRLGVKGVGGSTKAEIEFGPMFVRANLIDGAFPDYPRVIPKTEAGALLVDVDELRRAVAAVKVIHGRGDRTRAIVLSFADGTISASNPENGTVSLPLPGKRFDDPPARIGLNADYLGQLLEPFEGAVRLGFTDAAGPVLIRSPGRPEVLAVQMPMRV